MSTPWTAMSATVRGTWHEKTGQKNQDAVRLKIRHGQTGFLVMAVSDGHGSARSFRSDRGAALAVECALRLGEKFAVRFGHDAPISLVRGQMRRKWWHYLLADWRKAVRADILAHPFSPLDFAAFPEPPPDTTPGREWPFGAYLAYGATLLFVMATRHYTIYAQIGDGDILAVSTDGTVSRPLARHHEFFANQSASLCTHGAIREFQVSVVPARRDPPAAILLSSDGYANCFGSDDGFFKVGSDLLAYAREQGPGFISSQIDGWLRESSREGSGDDITLALAFRKSELR